MVFDYFSTPFRRLVTIINKFLNEQIAMGIILILIFITDRFCWRCGTAAAVGRLVRKVRAPTYLV